MKSPFTAHLKAAGRFKKKRRPHLNKRISKKMHKRFLTDVAYGISLSSDWRRKLFSLPVGRELLINRNCADLPPYVEPYFRKYNLMYTVCVDEKCPEFFGEGLVIFKFAPKQFKDVCFYSGNNPQVI